jgi:hemoglobin
MTLRRASIGALFLLAASASLAGTAPIDAPAGSLYARLGGTPKVSAFVNQAIERVAADPRANPSFDQENLQRVKDMLLQQICTLTGGCTCTGDAMREVHAGPPISADGFYGLVEELRGAMRAQGVPLAARNELLDLIAPVTRDVAKL